MDSQCIKQTVCKVLKIFQYGKYLVVYVLKYGSNSDQQKMEKKNKLNRDIVSLEVAFLTRLLNISSIIHRFDNIKENLFKFSENALKR